MVGRAPNDPREWRQAHIENQHSASSPVRTRRSAALVLILMRFMPASTCAVSAALVDEACERGLLLPASIASAARLRDR